MNAIILFGLAVVLVALIVLVVVVRLVSQMMNNDVAVSRSQETTGETSSMAQSPSALPVMPQGGVPQGIIPQGIALETIAVISAAVAAIMDEEAPGTAYAIAGIQSSQRSHAQRPVWGFAGMQQNTRPF